MQEHVWPYVCGRRVCVYRQVLDEPGELTSLRIWPDLHFRKIYLQSKKASFETIAEIRYSGDRDLIMVRNSRPWLTKIHRKDLVLQVHGAHRKTSFKEENLHINRYLSCPIMMKHIHILPIRDEFLH